MTKSFWRQRLFPYRKNNMKKKYIVYFVIALFVSVVSYLVGGLLAPEVKPRQDIVRTVLPPKVVTDFAVQQLNADIQGTITAKDNQSVTFITSKGTTVKAYEEPQGITTLVKADELPITLAELKVGDKINGGISVVVSEESTVGKTGQRKVGDVILHYVTVAQTQ